MISIKAKELLLKLYSSGKSINYICDILHISKATISYQINKAGISRYKPPVELTEEILSKMQEEYNICKDLRIVSKRFKVSINRLKVLDRRVYKTSYEILRNRRYRIKDQLVQYKGGKCQICGYCRCLSALEFHHLDPSNKDFTIASNMKYSSLNQLKIETDKCILVCSNCHREIHSKVIEL